METVKPGVHLSCDSQLEESDADVVDHEGQDVSSLGEYQVLYWVSS